MSGVAQFRFAGSGARRRLAQLLPWDAYFSSEQHELEGRRLFAPAWHCVAVRDDLARAGDFVTVDVTGLPVLVHNQGDRLAAFHNVCAHRNSLVLRAPRGNVERVTCGYHGWEYDRDGVACRIPGGECFKPMKPGEFALDRVRVDTVGQLVFVCLDAGAPPLAAWLGEAMHARLACAFGAGLRRADAWTVEFRCNWKVLVENTLEDYHVGVVHTATAGATPPASQIEHTLGPTWNTIENRAPEFASRTMRWLAGRLRDDAEFTYFQHIAFPSLIFASSPLTSHLHVLEPTSPTTCRTRITLFLADRGGRLAGRALHAALRPQVSRLAHAFVEEDRRICDDVQRGIAAARFPGALGAREERVHHFQEWLLRATASAGAHEAAS